MAKTTKPVSVKNKTTATAVAAIVSAAAAYYTGDLPVGEAVTIGVNSLLAIFLRMGIAKAESGNSGN